MTGLRADFAALGSRARGCVLGGAIGDALGNPIEFDSLDTIRQLYGRHGLTRLESVNGAALITDDTQMTLFTIEGLIRAGVATAQGHDADTPTAVRRAYQRWLDTQSEGHARPGDHTTGWLRGQEWLYQLRAPGNACLSGLRQPGDGVARFTDWGVPGPINPKSKGCGSVMRAAPFGLINAGPQEIFELAARCALYTHGHPTGYLSAGALAAIVFFLVEDATLDIAVTTVLELLREYPSHEETVAALEAAVALARTGAPSPEKVETLGGGWIAEQALAIAVYCALAMAPSPRVPGQEVGAVKRDQIRRSLLLAVNHSGDSDSTGAICGNLLGAEHGHEALPPDWLILVEHRATITELADDLVLSLLHGQALAADSPAWTAKYPGD